MNDLVFKKKCIRNKNIFKNLCIIKLKIFEKKKELHRLLRYFDFFISNIKFVKTLKYKSLSDSQNCHFKEEKKKKKILDQIKQEFDVKIATLMSYRYSSKIYCYSFFSIYWTLFRKPS